MGGHRNTVANEWRRVCRERAYQIRGWHCEKCGKNLTERQAQGHHRWPKSIFGPNTVENCQLRCAKCEKKDQHWIAKNEGLVVDLLMKNELSKLGRIAPRGVFNDLIEPFSYYQALVMKAMSQQRQGNRFINYAQTFGSYLAPASRFATTFR